MHLYIEPNENALMATPKIGSNISIDTSLVVQLEKTLEVSMSYLALRGKAVWTELSLNKFERENEVSKDKSTKSFI